MKDKTLKIINNYGVNIQQRKLQEEVFELQEQIIRHDENAYPTNEFTDNIAEEIADVLVLLKQFQLYYGISNADIKSNMEFKIDRQIERIKDDI